MTVKERIQQDRIAALRAGEGTRKATLDYILGEIQKKEKDPAAKGDLGTAVIQAYLKSLREYLNQHREADPVRAAQYDAEIALLTAYLPAQLSADEIRAEAEVLIAAGTTKKGLIMKALKEKHGAALDGQLAAALLTEMGIQ